MSYLSLKSRTDSLDANGLIPSVVFLKQIVKKTPKPDNSRYITKEQISGTEEYLIAKSLRFTKRISHTTKFTNFPKFLPPLQQKTRSFQKINHELIINSITVQKLRRRAEGFVRQEKTPEPLQQRSRFVKGKPMKEFYQEFEPVFCIVNEKVWGREEEGEVEGEEGEEEEKIRGGNTEAHQIRFQIPKVEYEPQGKFMLVQENDY